MTLLSNLPLIFFGGSFFEKSGSVPQGTKPLGNANMAGGAMRNRRESALIHSALRTSLSLTKNSASAPGPTCEPVIGS